MERPGEAPRRQHGHGDERVARNPFMSVVPRSARPKICALASQTLG